MISQGVNLGGQHAGEQCDDDGDDETNSTRMKRKHLVTVSHAWDTVDLFYPRAHTREA